MVYACDVGLRPGRVDEEGDLIKTLLEPELVPGGEYCVINGEWYVSADQSSFRVLFFLS